MMSKADSDYRELRERRVTLEAESETKIQDSSFTGREREL